MSEPDSSTDERYVLSLEIQTPNALKIMRVMLDNIERSNDDVTRVSFEIESNKPFEHRETEYSKTNNVIEEKSNKNQNEGSTIPNEKALSSFPPESTRFKVASVLLHESEPLVIKEISNKLKNTTWETSKKIIGHKLRDLLSENKIIRNRREVDNLGSNPYEYQLTNDAINQLEIVENHILESKNGKTYKSVKENESSLDYECEICGDKFKTASGLGSHKHFKHSKNEEQNKDENKKESTILSPDTERFYAMSALYHSSKPMIPNDVSTRLEETKWSSDSSSLSATLGKLESEGLLDREKRHSERGNPYEYIINDSGIKIFEEAKNRAEKEGYDTFEEIIEGK